MDWMHSRLRVLAAAVGLLLIAALAFTATPARAATMWYTTATLAIAKLVADVNLTFGTVSANSHVSISGNPPQIIQWPLTAGASWDSSTTVWDVTTNSTGAVRYTQMPLATHFE